MYHASQKAYEYQNSIEQISNGSWARIEYILYSIDPFWLNDAIGCRTCQNT
jgi:hypothetical protein